MGGLRCVLHKALKLQNLRAQHQLGGLRRARASGGRGPPHVTPPSFGRTRVRVSYHFYRAARRGHPPRPRPRRNLHTHGHIKRKRVLRLCDRDSVARGRRSARSGRRSRGARNGRRVANNALATWSTAGRIGGAHSSGASGARARAAPPQGADRCAYRSLLRALTAAVSRRLAPLTPRLSSFTCPRLARCKLSRHLSSAQPRSAQGSRSLTRCVIFDAGRTRHGGCGRGFRARDSARSTPAPMGQVGSRDPGPAQGPSVVAWHV